MATTTTPLPSCTERLQQAEYAYHCLMTSQTAVKIAHGDREVEYNRTSAGALLTYIRQLKAECGSEDGTGERRRPVMFGGRGRGGCGCI